MIRPYTISDREELEKMFSLNVPKYFDPLELLDYLHYLDDQPDSYWTVIGEEDTIVGGVGCEIREDDSSGHITWIFFHPDFSGKGLGKQSVNHCLNIFFTDANVSKLVVRTSQFAHLFFEKFGYQTIEVKKDYWGKGLDLYHMEVAKDDAYTIT